MTFLARALFLWKEYFKNADISILAPYRQIFPISFSLYREILPNVINMPSFKLTGPSKQRLHGGGGEGQNLPSPGHTNLQKARPQ